MRPTGAPAHAFGAERPLTGQVALVTGGGRGIGRELARALAAADAAVAVTARTRAELAEVVSTIDGEGGRALAVPADVTDREAIDRVVSEVEDRLGPVDVLVNNAGRFQAVGPLWDLDPDDWWRELEVNLRGPLLCTRAVLPSMLARGGGRIVNLTSGAATGSPPAASAYSAGKTALLRLTETLAGELAGTGLSVFAIEPGTLRTSMNEELLRTQEPVLRRWAPWFLDLFDEHREDPFEPVGDLVVRLAAGGADALSGRFLSVHDDLDDLLARSAQIHRDDLLTLRLRPSG